MANSKVKTNALKRILQAPGGVLVDEELFRLVKKQDRSAESLVLKKFILAVSEIPLIEYSQTTKTFTFSRHAHKARSYFLFMAYLFGEPVASRWPDFKKLTAKITEVNPAHFLNSYCHQTIAQEKLNSYNIQMHTLLDFVLKKGKGKDIIYDRIIMEVLVDYFPALNIGWVWLFNEIVKEPRPKNLVQSTLTLEKAQSQLTKIVKKVAKDCEIEVQRLRVDSSSNSTSLNWADVASSKVSTSGELKSNPVVTEAIPLSSEYFITINGSEGRTLKYIEEVSGAKISLGKMKNGLTGFTTTGTKTQNDLAIKEVLKLVDEKNEPPKKEVKQTSQRQFQETVEIVTYSTDILEKFVTKKESLTMLGSFTERYPGIIIKVEPNKQRVVVKGKIPANVKTVTEYLRESLADFAADLVAKNNKKHLMGAGKTPDTPVTKPLSAGSKYNTWIHANQQELLQIALKNHVSLRFPSVKRSSTDILTISGKLQNVEQTDRDILSKLQIEPDYSILFKPLQPLQTSPQPPVTPEVKASLPHKPPDLPHYPPKPSDSPANSPAKENLRPDNKAGISGADKDKKSDKPIDWFEHEEDEPMRETQETKISKPVDTYEDMELKSTLVEGIYASGLEKPSTVHSALIPLLLAGQKVLVEADLGSDICNALLIAVLQQVNFNLRQTQGFILLRDKLLIPATLAILRGLTAKIPLISEGLLDTTTTFPDIPHIVLSTPQLIKSALENQSIVGGKAKVLVYTDLSLTVGSFGYQIIQKKYFNDLIIDPNTKLIFQSGEPLPTKVYNLLEKFGEDKSLETIKFEPREVVGAPKFSIGKGLTTPEKPFQSPLNNLSERQLDLAKKNLYLVYSVIKGYPELELIQKDADLILSGKAPDVKAAKVKIQEMIVLHDKGKPSPSTVKSPSPVKTMAQVASTNANINENQSINPRSPLKTESLPSTRPPNTTRPPTFTTPAPSSNVPTQPVPVITKLVTMDPQENGFVYRNREIVEKLIHEFPGSSINFSPYENDNISVTGPVDKIAQIHKRVLDGIRSAIENKHASVKKARLTSLVTSPGRLSAELDSFRADETSDPISTQPAAKSTPVPPAAPAVAAPPVSISFDTSAELRAFDSGYNPAAKRHQHSVLSSVTHIPGPPPGYSDAESVCSDKPDSSAGLKDEKWAAATPNPVSSVPNDSWSASVTRAPTSDSVPVSYSSNYGPPSSATVSSNTTTPPSGLQPNPGTRPPNTRSPSGTRPPNSSIPPSTIPPNFPNVHPVAPFEDMLMSSPLQPNADSVLASNSIPATIPSNTSSSQDMRPPNSAPVTRPPKADSAQSTRPPNMSSIPATRPPNMDYIPATRPPVAGSSTTTRPPVAGSSTTTRPPVEGSSTTTRPPVAGSSTTTRPPVAGSSTTTRPPVAGSSTTTRPPVAGSSTTTRPPHSDSDSGAISKPPDSAVSPHTTLNPLPSGVATPPTSSSKTSPTVPVQAVNGVPSTYNHNSNQNLSSTLYNSSRENLQAPNGFSWDILRRIPVDIPDLPKGSPEHWMYNKVREKISSGLSASVPITELVRMFAKEFNVVHVDTANLTKEFYKCLKSRPRIFLTEVQQLPSGKRTINVALNLPKQQMPPPSTQFVAPRHTIPATRTPPSSTAPLVTGAMTPAAMTPPQASIVSDPSRTPTLATTAPVSTTSTMIPSITAVIPPVPLPVAQAAVPTANSPHGASAPSPVPVGQSPMRTPLIPSPDLSSNAVTNSNQNLVSPAAPCLNTDSNQTAASDRESSRKSSLTIYSNFEDMLYSPPTKSDQADVLASDQAVPSAEVVDTRHAVIDSGISQGDVPPIFEEPRNKSNDPKSDRKSPSVSNVNGDPSVKEVTENTSLPANDLNIISQPTESVSEVVSVPLVPLGSPVWESASSQQTDPKQPASETITPPSESDTFENSSSGASTIPQLSLQTPDPLEQTSEAPSDQESTQNTARSRSEHSSESDYILCGKSETDVSGALSSSRSSGVMVDNLSVSSGAENSSATKEDKLDETFTKLNLSSSESADNDGEDEEEEEHYTTFFTSSRRAPCSIGASGDSTFLNINATQPSYILVHGGDTAAKNSIMKQIVDVWVKLGLPVMVVSPELKSVSSHTDIDFYQFKTITGTEDLELVDRCEKFLTSESCSSLKLLVINTVHKAMDTKEFLSVLAEQYEQFNVVVLTIAPPQPIDIATGILTTWRRVKKDRVLQEISNTFETDLGPAVNQIKRGTLVSLSLDDDEIKPLIFTSLFGK